ncbi:MAG: hypothetical protein DBX52_04465 [Clostridiales bacterium]|nr:MAG: hypothetical protein DBX52_04465 [Clostridiales bacterium]
MLTPEAIQKKEFEQSVLGGYRRDEVDAFLDEIEADYRKLYVENTEMVEKLKVCLSKIEDYKKDEEFLKTAIINAQKLNETTLHEIELREKEVELSSKEKAAEIIAHAEEQAKAIVQKAERESADAVRAAREQCRSEIDAEQKKAADAIRLIHKETEAEQKKLDYIHKQVADFKNTILEIYKAHLTSISKLPDFKSEDEPPKAEPAVPSEPAPAQPEVKIAAAQPEKAEKSEIEKEPEPEKTTVKPVKPEGNTVEFKLNAKPEKKTEQNRKPSANSLKFENLKFGVDYDINKDE